MDIMNLHQRKETLKDDEILLLTNQPIKDVKVRMLKDDEK